MVEVGGRIVVVDDDGGADALAAFDERMAAASASSDDDWRAAFSMIPLTEYTVVGMWLERTAAFAVDIVCFQSYTLSRAAQLHKSLLAL